MSLMGHVMQSVGYKIVSFLRQEPPPWLQEIPPLRQLLPALEQKRTRVQQVMAALEIAHFILADQDEYDIDAMTFAVSQETILAMQNAIL